MVVKLGNEMVVHIPNPSLDPPEKFSMVHQDLFLINFKVLVYYMFSYLGQFYFKSAFNTGGVLRKVAQKPLLIFYLNCES